MKKYVLFSLLMLAAFGAGCEHEGYLNVSDCRETTPVREDSVWNYINSYTCAYQKNSQGEIYGGTCCRVETAAFTDKCLKAYCYTKSSQVTCGDNEFIGTNGECYCKPGYVSKDSGCVLVQADGSASQATSSSDGTWILTFWVVVAILVYVYVKNKRIAEKKKTGAKEVSSEPSKYE